MKVFFFILIYMKLDAQFESKNGKLFSIKNGCELTTENLIQADIAGTDPAVLASDEFARKFSRAAKSIICACVAWKTIELVPGSYNEEYLASLREFLKKTEALGISAIIVPVTEGRATDAEFERYTAAMVHTARRIKDCESVIGFALPDEVAAVPAAIASFIEAMAVKHAQYVYFSAQKCSNSTIIPYRMR
jgi:hypothetical protein